MLLSNNQQPDFFSPKKGRVFLGAFSILAVLTLIALLSLDSVSFLALPATAAPEPPKPFRYFDTTGHGLSGPLLRYYTRTGGQERHGVALSEPVRYKNYYRQFFENTVLEFYPEYDGTGEEVKLMPLGQNAAADAKLNFSPVAPFIGTADKWYFPETGHSLAEPFLSYWRNSGEINTFGLPISEEYEETWADGKTQLVQYFENTRLQRPTLASTEITIASLGTAIATQQLKPNQLAAIPRTRFEAPRNLRIPSLMFHYARVVSERADPLGFGLSITPPNYLKFLDWVQANGYNTVTASQVLDYFKYGILLPEKPVMFRWDDGHDNNWFVYQEMKKRGMTATFFVISQRLELTPIQWKQIDQDGFEVTAHTRTHPDLRGVRDLTSEITASKRDIELILGHPVRTFAYPYGKYNDVIKRVVRDSGFELAVTTNGGYNWNDSIMLEQPVISVTGYDDVTSFADKIMRASYPPAQVGSGSNNSNTAPNDKSKTAAPAPAPTKAPVKTNKP